VLSGNSAKEGNAIFHMQFFSFSDFIKYETLLYIYFILKISYFPGMFVILEFEKTSSFLVAQKVESHFGEVI
jgi:hypothetical protein